jgi:hypothetical protein
MAQMSKKIAKVNQALWMFAELGLLLVLICVLIFLVLGQQSGALILSVMENIFALTGRVDAANLIGLSILVVLIYAVKARLAR